MSYNVVIRVKSKGNKIGAAALSRLNKMGNPPEILKKLNELAQKQPTKKVMVAVEGTGLDQKLIVIYPGDAQALAHLKSRGDHSWEELNKYRAEYNRAPITMKEYLGVLKSSNV